MLKIYVENENELDNFIYDNMSEKIGEGIEGSCYLTQNGDVIKKLKYSRSEEFLERLEGINIKGVSFPYGGVLIKRFVHALLLKYVKGEPFKNIRHLFLDLTALEYSLNDLLQTIRELSYLGIVITDFYLGNIIFDGINFTLIDTQSYTFLDDFNSLERGESLYNRNVEYVMKCFYHKLFSDDCEIRTLLMTSPLNKYMTDIGLLGNPIAMIEELRAYLQIKYREYIVTLSDMKRLLTK